MRLPSIRLPVLSEADKKRATLGLAVVLVAFVLVVTTGPVTGFFVLGNPYEGQIENLTTSLATTELSLSDASSSLGTCQQDLQVRQNEVADVSSALVELQTSASACSSELQTAKSDLSSAEEELSVSVAYATQLANEKAQFEEEKAQLESEKTQLQSDYNDVVSNTAQDLCCVNRVFDGSLTHYYVEKNQIICTTDDTKTPFSCE